MDSATSQNFFQIIFFFVILHVGCYDHHRTPFYSTFSELSIFQEIILSVFSFAILFFTFPLQNSFQTTGVITDYHLAFLHKDALCSVSVCHG